MAPQLINDIKPFLKAFKLDIPYYFFRSRLYRRIAVLCEKDLTSLQAIQYTQEQAGVRIVLISSNSLRADNHTVPELVYPDATRLKTALRYLERGYRGVALVSGKEIYGDMWYTHSDNKRRACVHPDLKWLRVKCCEGDTYAFDMYLQPDRRGMNLASLLQIGALHEIRKSGFLRVFGYYWVDNIPSLWVHRTLKWKELQRLKVTRLFWLQYSSEC